MQSNQDQRADSRWEQMTTPTGHNSRDPGVPSTPERRRGSGGGEGGGGGGWGAGGLVGKNQTGPNYRNHNESVSRGTLLPGKHQGICVHCRTHTTSTHTLTRSKECRSAQVLYTCTHLFFLLYSFAKKHIQEHMLV